MRDFIARLDAYCGVASCPQNAPPTEESIRRINHHFSIAIPDELIYLAQHCKSYRAMFVSLGPDYADPDHIIRVNSFWRRRRVTRRLPRHLVMFRNGHDEHCWCFDIADTLSPLPVQFWSPDELHYPSSARPITRYPSFSEYLDGLCQWEFS